VQSAGSRDFRGVFGCRRRALGGFGVRRCMEASEDLWKRLEMYASIWKCVKASRGMYGSVWKYMKASGSVRKRLEVYGSLGSI
jgi:hypothetical protein